MIVRRRLGCVGGCRIGDVAHGVAGLHADGQHGLGPTPAPRIAFVVAGLVTPDLVHRVRVASEHIRAVVVVHGEDPAGGEVVAHRFHGLAGEEVALESERPLAAHQGQRVGQGEQDQVVRLIAPLQEGPAIIDVHGDARVLVRVRGVVVPTGLLQDRIDLDRIHRGGSLRQGVRHVVATARAHDQHIADGPASEMRVGRGVELLRESLHGPDRLVRQGVGADPIRPSEAMGYTVTR